jgi:hypothetical protein
MSSITLIKGDKVSANTDYRDALPVNVSAVLRPILGAVGYMLQQPGLTQLGTGRGVDRGGVWNERFNAHYRVSGTKFIRVAANGAVTELGNIDGTDTVSMPYSFNTQAIVANGKYYLYDPVNGFRRIEDVDLGNPIDAVWVDGLYFFTDGEFLYHTDLTSESSINPLKYATSEFAPDPTLGVSLTVDNKVIAWNRYSTEYFVNQATELFQFSPLPSRTVKYGIVGTHCKAEIGGEFFFMGGPKEGNISIFRLGVGQAINISTREVDKVIAQYNEQQLAVAKLETRIVDNYPYLIVRLPNETLQFNILVAGQAGEDQAWCILKSGITGSFPFRGINGVFDPRTAQWVVGDTISDKIGYLDESVATQYGDIVECEMFTPFVKAETGSINQIEIETIPGFTASSDATVFLSMTYDGNFYSMETLMDYGMPSQYSTRFIKRRLGYVRNWFGMKFRWASRSRMAFGLLNVDVS